MPKVPFAPCRKRGQAMNEELFKKLIDTLESIDANLSDISGSLECINDNLEGCIAQNGRNKFICVTGNITNY